MPRFFFHLHNDVDVQDHGGKCLPDLDAARTYAIEMARFEVAESAMREGRIVLSHRIDIGDETGAVLESVRFSDAVDVAP